MDYEILAPNNTMLQTVPRDFSEPVLGDIEEAIRPDCRGEYSKTARDLYELGYYRHAVLEYWNRAMSDLKDKLVTYGLQHLPKELGIKVRSKEDFLKVVDSKIIEASHRLGLIDGEAYLFLTHGLNVRNSFTAAHDTKSPIDAMEALNFIKNCVKYVLQRNLPSPAMNIKDIMAAIQSESFDTDNLIDIINDQSPSIVDSLLTRIFDEYTTLWTSDSERDNFDTIIKVIWEKVDDKSKQQIGQKFAEFKIEGEVDKSLLAMNFILVVGGMNFVPHYIKKTIFQKASTALIRAHHGPNNFYNEPSFAENLRNLGYDIPKDSLSSYVKAVTFSFCGNYYGVSDRALMHNTEMLKNFSANCVERLLHDLSNDKDYALKFVSENPCGRLKELFKILLEKKNVTVRQREALENYKNNPNLRSHFIKLQNKD